MPETKQNTDQIEYHPGDHIVIHSLDGKAIEGTLNSIDAIMYSHGYKFTLEIDRLLYKDSQIKERFAVLGNMFKRSIRLK